MVSTLALDSSLRQCFLLDLHTQLLLLLSSMLSLAPSKRCLPFLPLEEWWGLSHTALSWF